MNVRFDLISHFEDREKAIEEMNAIRDSYIYLYSHLENLFSQESIPSVKRTYAIALTNLEISSQYAIKACCLKHEVQDK